ncbi:MAG: methyl-accepting chemotaxis protein [Desulfovibrionaceae bacterium]|nr:methyl-accepting chemotaxis protein [Desulfovibrionaceae bacterium]
MKLSTKLIASFGLLIVLLLVSGGISFIMTSDIYEDTEDLAKNWLPSIETLGLIQNKFQALRRNELVHITTTEQAEMREYEAAMEKEIADLKAAQATYEKLISSPEERTEYGIFKSALDGYLAAHPTLIQHSRKNENDAAKALILGDSRKYFRDAYASLDKLIEMNNKGADVSVHKAEAEYHSSVNYTIAILSFALLVGIAAATLVIRGVTRQLGEDPGYLYDIAGKIAAGDLTVAFRPQKTEGGVYAVLKKMVDTLKAKIAEADGKAAEAAQKEKEALAAMQEAEQAKALAETAKRDGMLQAAARLEGVVATVSSASEELSAQIEQSSRGSESQAQRVGETATAMEEMNATVLEVAKNASQAAETSDTAKKKAQEGSGVVEQVIREIANVQEQAVTLKTDMDTLGKQAEGIGRIMNVISDIADQTNLLALNAAIEAARAGDAGRGFAVVADEVRKLAEKTMTATKEVGEAISGIQQGTRRNIENVERSSHSVEEATKLAKKSGESLTEIVSLVDAASDQVRSIATASEQQSSASEEINRSIEEISTISSETSQAMGQAAQAVSELARQSQELQSLIEDMQSENGGRGSSSRAIAGSPRKPGGAARPMRALA